MGWKGMAIGSCLGSLIGGTLGAIFGAFLGNALEKKLTGSSSSRRSAYETASPDNQRTIFLATAAAMLAKLAKADGHISQIEIRAVEHAFQRLGFPPDARRYAVRVFRRAKDDSHSIYEYATEFAQVVRSVEVRVLFYELLWDLACADGTVMPGEMEILRNIPRVLAIPPVWFDVFARERLRGYSNSNSSSNSSSSSDSTSTSSSFSSLANAYALLGVSPTASDDEVKKAYRLKAKKYHPDALRAQGLPEEMVTKATEMMAKINAAWSEIEKARKL